MTVAAFAASVTLAGLGGALLVRDLRSFRLPNVLTLGLLLSGLGFVLVLDRSQAVHHVLGALVGYGAFVLLALGYRLARGRDGLGAGDAKLMAGAGAWVGWQGLPSTVLVGAAVALAATLVVAGLRRAPVSATTRVPLGAFLVIGLWTTWLFGPLRF